MKRRVEHVDHPSHYGGKDDPYEAIKIIEAWGLGFSLGNAAKYVCRAGKKDGVADLGVRDLQKAAWYLGREIENRKRALEAIAARKKPVRRTR